MSAALSIDEKTLPLPGDANAPVDDHADDGDYTDADDSEEEDVDDAETAKKNEVVEIASEDAGPALVPAGVNLFKVRGDWKDDMVKATKISFPTFGHANETTNDKTRERAPEARYWKAPITFKYREGVETLIRFDGVHIPYHAANPKYGTDFVYACFPPAVGRAIAAAGKQVRPTISHEESLVPDDNRWWKILNKCEGKFGVLNKTTKTFNPKSLRVIFDNTNMGVTVNIFVKVNAKCRTEDKSLISSTTLCRVELEPVQAFIQAVNVDVEMPQRVKKVKAKAEPAVLMSDAATDDLLAQLAAMGI